ncbi:hypothetical protein B296_00048858 [Ensete ventricosum]|uniref:DUF4005 domain-containing protein n=1 Tax=Ensete ventricosum TaxID=4639 RepID=A0A426YLX0_ENSVE|nr:hypothetical protein B296_00048858 [Ensete ventricosum]
MVNVQVQIEEEWDDSLRSKEKIEANLLNRQEASVRRERALAYAFSHQVAFFDVCSFLLLFCTFVLYCGNDFLHFLAQWKSSSRSLTPAFTDPRNPQWGWSWLERWMAARPWENHKISETNDHDSIRSATFSLIGQTMKRRDTSLERTPSAFRKSSRPPSRQSPMTPQSKPRSRKISLSPRGGRRLVDEDARSMASFQSERPRRHSIAGSSARDDESLVSSQSIPSYMASTESARARSRFHSPQSDMADTPGKRSICSVKKRLSFPMADDNSISSPASRIRRYSEPPKVDISPVNKNNE